MLRAVGDLTSRQLRVVNRSVRYPTRAGTPELAATCTTGAPACVALLWCHTVAVVALNTQDLRNWAGQGARERRGGPHSHLRALHRQPRPPYASGTRTYDAVHTVRHGTTCCGGWRRRRCGRPRAGLRRPAQTTLLAHHIMVILSSNTATSAAARPHSAMSVPPTHVAWPWGHTVAVVAFRTQYLGTWVSVRCSRLSVTARRTRPRLHTPRP